MNHKYGFSRNNWEDSGMIFMIYACLKVGYTPSLWPLNLELITKSYTWYWSTSIVGNNIHKYVSKLCSSQGEEIIKGSGEFQIIMTTARWWSCIINICNLHHLLLSKATLCSDNFDISRWCTSVTQTLLGNPATVGMMGPVTRLSLISTL